jgi:uncharacterized ParB-like nuclease family protein
MRNGRLLGVMATRGLFSTTKLIPLPPAGCGETEEAKSAGAQALMDTLDCTADGLTAELRRRGQKTVLAGGVRQQPRKPLPVPLVRELTHGRCISAMRRPWSSTR